MSKIAELITNIQDSEECMCEETEAPQCLYCLSIEAQKEFIAMCAEIIKLENR